MIDLFNEESKSKLIELIYSAYAECDSLMTPYITYRGAEVMAEHILNKNITFVPYKPGDILYYIDRETGKLETDTIKYITITKEGAKPILADHNIRFWEDYTFGVNVFLSKTAAEKVLNKK